MAEVFQVMNESGHLLVDASWPLFQFKAKFSLTLARTSTSAWGYNIIRRLESPGMTQYAYSAGDIVFAKSPFPVVCAPYYQPDTWGTSGEQILGYKAYGNWTDNNFTAEFFVFTQAGLVPPAPGVGLELYDENASRTYSSSAAAIRMAAFIPDTPSNTVVDSLTTVRNIPTGLSGSNYAHTILGPRRAYSCTELEEAPSTGVFEYWIWSRTQMGCLISNGSQIQVRSGVTHDSMAPNQTNNSTIYSPNTTQYHLIIDVTGL